MLPCPSYCKQCCDERWGTCVSFNFGFLGVHARMSVKAALDCRTTISILWNFPSGAVVTTAPPTAGEQVQSLVRELRSCMPQGAVSKQNPAFLLPYKLSCRQSTCRAVTRLSHLYTCVICIDYLAISMR